ERGRRLLPVIAIGGTAGAAAGAWLHTLLVGGGPRGEHLVLLAAASLLGLSVPLVRSAERRAPVGPKPGAAAPFGGLRRVLGNRFLRAAGLLALLLSWASTNGDNLLFQVVQQRAASDAALTRSAITAFY